MVILRNLVMISLNDLKINLKKIMILTGFKLIEITRKKLWFMVYRMLQEISKKAKK